MFYAAIADRSQSDSGFHFYVGRLVLGADLEFLRCAAGRWTPAHYRAQWRLASAQLTSHPRATSAFVTSVAGGVDNLEWWMARRRGNWPPRPVPEQPTRPFTYLPAADNVYVISHDCYIGCEAGTHDDSCEVIRANQIIESRYLDDQLQRGAEISQCIGLAGLEAAPYILDIDLDVFHTRRAISPEDTSTFYRLVKNAVAITIATKAQCVDEEWLDDDDKMSADELLAKLLAHIDKAL